MLMLYLQLLSFPFLTLAGIFIAKKMACHRHWRLAVIVAFAFIAIVILGHRSARLSFLPPISWAIAPDINPFLMTVVISTLFSMLIARLPPKAAGRGSTSRSSVAVMMAMLLIYYGVLPALLPLMVRASLLATKTSMDSHHICLQTHGYTCGPASAVTCLARLGISAGESSLAIDARCAPAFGTDGHLLAQSIHRQFPNINAQFRYVENLDDLTVPAVVDMQMTHIGGHYVAVLEIRPKEIVVGDPLSGQGTIPRQEFLAEWCHGAIEFTCPACVPLTATR
ncbi:MAG TPA: cysteine peptidase family C39 domain-containing protein [Phycisphaerae bacterium]|jgi:predicted double-glycine peptidase